jgi:hypothetical protein
MFELSTYFVLFVCFRWCFVCGGESDLQGKWTALIDAAANIHAVCVRLLPHAGSDKDSIMHMFPSFLDIFNAFYSSRFSAFFSIFGSRSHDAQIQNLEISCEASSFHVHVTSSSFGVEYSVDF